MTCSKSRIPAAFVCLAAMAMLCLSAGLRAEEQTKPRQPQVVPPAKGQEVPGAQQPMPKPGAMNPNPPQVKVPGQEIPEPTVKLKEGEVPAVKFDTPTYDFGRVRSGQEITHDFWFSNTGTGPLELLKVRPSCGCTTAGEHDKIVQPGQSGKIPIRLNTGHASGPIHKTIMINTNAAGEGAAVTLHIQGEVWQPIQATPASASFGRLTTDTAASASMERKLTVVNNTDEKIKITKAVSSNPSFKADISEIEEGKKFELTVAVVPPLSTGPVTGNIELTTTMQDNQKMLIPVNAYVTADVDVTPNQLTLTPNRNGTVQRQFFIRNNTVNPVKISEQTASNEKLQLNIVETQPVGKAYRLTVDIPQDYVVSEGGDKITLKTDNPNVPNLIIPINQVPPMGDVTKQFGMEAGKNPGMMNQPPAQAGQDHAGHDHAGHNHGATTPQPAQPQPAQPQPAQPANGAGK